MIKKHHFNLIEITLAMLVISIGIMAIMGLIPIGARAHSDAVHKNQAADAAEQILNMVAFASVRDWAGTVGTFNPATRSWSGGKLAWDRATTLVSAAPKELALSSDTYWGSPLINEGLAEGIYVFQKTEAQLYRMVRTHDAIRNGKTAKIHEFDAVFAVWADPVTGPYKDSGGVFRTNTVLGTAVRLNIEASWPGGLDYNSRQKMYFSMEVQQP